MSGNQGNIMRTSRFMMNWTVLFIILSIIFIVWINKQYKSPVASLKGNFGPIFSSNISPDGTILAIGTGGFDSYLYDTKDWTELVILSGHTSAISTLMFSPDGKILVMGSYDKKISIWNVEKRSVISTIDCDMQILKLEFTSDGKQIAVALGQKVEIWNISCKNPTLSATIKSGAYSISFLGSSMKFISTSENGIIKVWNSKDNTVNHEFTTPLGDIVFSSVSKNGQIISLSDTNDIYIIHMKDKGSPRSLLINARSTCIAISPRGDIIASALPDANIVLFNTYNGKMIGTLKGHHRRINTLCFTPDGNNLISGGDDRILYVWKVK